MTGWVRGMASDNFDDYYENPTDAIGDTDAWEETQRTISETQEGIRNTQQELEQTAEELRQEAADQAKQVSQILMHRRKASLLMLTGRSPP